MIKEIVDIFNVHNIKTEIIVASVRQLIHVIEVAKSGAHMATVPYNVIVKMSQHPLTDEGIETFSEDWKCAQSKWGFLLENKTLDIIVEGFALHDN